MGNITEFTEEQNAALIRLQDDILPEMNRLMNIVFGCEDKKEAKR